MKREREYVGPPRMFVFRLRGACSHQPCDCRIYHGVHFDEGSVFAMPLPLHAGCFCEYEPLER